MILYLDTSALVKRYINETGTPEVEAAVRQSATTGTVLITRAEVAAALARAVRMGLVTYEVASQDLANFREDWNDYERLEIDEPLIARADSFAWQYQLRGYDAVHLAAGVNWQEALNEPVTFATFDQKLWTAARQAGLESFPPMLVQEQAS